MIDLLHIRRCLQRVALAKVQLAFPCLRYQWSWKMGKLGNLPMSLGIVSSTSINGLFLGPGVPVCNGGYRMCGIWVVVVARNTRRYVDSMADIVLRNSRIV